MSEGPISIIWSAFDVSAGRDYCLLINWHSILVVRHLQVEIQRLKKKYSVRAKLEGIA
jgi:hypothetical protein